MASGIDYVKGLGLENVQEHARCLTERFHQGLVSIPGATIKSATALGTTTGIATVSLDNIGGVEFSAALRDEWKVITRPALWQTSVRFSLAPYVEAEDIDYVLDA